MNFQGNLSLDHEASENENAFLVDSQPEREAAAGISSYFFCRNLVKQVALMMSLTRAPRFLGTMCYYYSLLLAFTFIISGMFAMAAHNLFSCSLLGAPAPPS